jgi:hypothetical protein
MHLRPRVFISYSSVDRHHAERLVAALVLNAIHVWYDRDDIGVGQNLYARIQEGLLGVDYVGVILTARSLESAWVTEELSLAKQRELEERHVIVLPLLFENVTLPLHLRARKYADFTDFMSGLRELMRVVDNRAPVNVLDETIRKRIGDAISDLGSGTATDVQAVRSQQFARITRGIALGIGQVANHLARQPSADGHSQAQVFVDILSADASIPIVVDLAERSGSVLARVLQAIGVDGIVTREQRFSFLLLYEGIPLELNETLRDAGIIDGAHLQLGAYTFLIE